MTEVVTLEGQFRDVLTDAAGRVIWDSGWQHNLIVDDCRRLLAGFMHGPGTTVVSVEGLQVGSGDAAWDQLPNPPPVSSAKAGLDQPTFTVLRSAMPVGTSIQFEYVDTSTSPPSATNVPTNRLQIIARLGPGVPPAPASLREFGLVAKLDGQQVLVNYRRHPLIAKDAFSTLTRTIWLTF